MRRAAVTVCVCVWSETLSTVGESVQFSSNSDLVCIKMWVSSKLECDVVFFLLFFMRACVWFAHSGHSLSVSVWTVIDSCSHAPSGQLTCSYMNLSFSLSVHPIPHFPLSLTSSPTCKLSFSCQTVIDMFLYLQQSALHLCHHKTHMLKHFYSTQSPTGEILHHD